MGLSLAWTLSCGGSGSQTANTPEPTAVDAGMGGAGAANRPGSPAGKPGPMADAGAPSGGTPPVTKDASAATGTAGATGAAGTSGAAGTTGAPKAPDPSGAAGTGPAVTTGAAGTGPAVTTGAGGAPGGSGTPVPPPVVTRRIAVFGDYGADTEEEADVAALVAAWNPDAVITAGDNNYTSGTFEGYDQNVGKHYHQFMGSYRGKFGAGAATNRFFPALGDHDWEMGVAPYVDYFTLPGNERYYDVDLGPVHLYAINSNPEEPDGYQPTSAQGTWLKNKLASSSSCFDLVYFHHPPYSSGEHGSRPHMNWPFAAWGAEATFAGHDHNYERLDVNGIQYFVVGMGGLGLRAFPGGPLPETKFRDDKNHGAMLVTASSDGTITYEFWSTSGVKLDTYTVKKACRGHS